MAIPHAKSGEVIDVRPLAGGLAGARTHVLVKTETLEVIRLVVPRGKEIPSHAAPGEILVQCLEGRIAFTSGGDRRELGAGEMLYLEREQAHAVAGVEDASVLLTITFPRNAPRADRTAHRELSSQAGKAEQPSSRRGGLVDFDSSATTDLVDEASQESFPASDPPGFIYCDTPQHACDEPGKKGDG